MAGNIFQGLSGAGIFLLFIMSEWKITFVYLKMLKASSDRRLAILCWLTTYENGSLK